MKKAMITVCGDFGDKHWVSDMLLTTVAKLSQRLVKLGIEIVYADSMDNSQMREPYEKGLKIESEWAKERFGVDYLFLLYWHCSESTSGCNHPWFRIFTCLRGMLSKDIVLYLVDVSGDSKIFSDNEREMLSNRGDIKLIRDIEIESLFI